MATIIAGLVIFLLAGFAMVRQINKGKNGDKSGCSGCSGCGISDGSGGCSGCSFH